MVNFACKKVEIMNVVRCSLGLSKGEVIILKFLVKNSGKFYSTSEIAKKMKFELSTVQKCVKKLFESDVLIKHQRNLDSGGYEFVYTSKSSDEVREIIMSTVKAWVSRLEEQICKF